MATVRPTKTINSLTLDLWKYPKWPTSDAFARIIASDPSGLHFKTRSAVIFIFISLSLSKKTLPLSHYCFCRLSYVLIPVEENAELLSAVMGSIWRSCSCSPAAITLCRHPSFIAKHIRHSSTLGCVICFHFYFKN